MPKIEHVPVECQICGNWSLHSHERAGNGLQVVCTFCNENYHIPISTKEIPSHIRLLRGLYTVQLRKHPELAVLRVPGDHVTLKEEDEV